MTTAPPEAEFEQMEVRDKWKDEARDFTPWLAENLDLLGRAIGMELKPIQEEQQVGPFSLDIMAREADEGVIIAIENQLEWTDTGHLGQLLTYAAGCGAHIAIWVAPDFRYEHAQALHRLNEWTGERIRFYGVKVEVVRKTGDSSLEARFQKVVYPGGWDKDITQPPGQTESPEARKHREFFQPLIDELLREGFAEKAIQYYGRAGRFFPSRLHPYIGYAASLGEKDACVFLHVRPDDGEDTKRTYDGLHQAREQIEACIDAGPDTKWRWERSGGATSSYIYVRRYGSIDDSPKKLEETRAWMRDLLPKFKEVFDPRLKELLEQSPPQPQP